MISIQQVETAAGAKAQTFLSVSARLKSCPVTCLALLQQNLWAGLSPLPYLCSHMRSADSNCSVLTGLARYSEAPASRHFSRSPFMALAVRAMMGSRRNDGFCLITCIVS